MTNLWLPDYQLAQKGIISSHGSQRRLIGYLVLSVSWVARVSLVFVLVV